MTTCNLSPATLAMLADLTDGWDVQIRHARLGKAWCVTITNPDAGRSFLYTDPDLGTAIGRAYGGGRSDDEVQPW